MKFCRSPLPSLDSFCSLSLCAANSLHFNLRPTWRCNASSCPCARPAFEAFLSLAPTPPIHQMKYVKPLSLFQGLLKIEPSKRGRLLGLDVGDKYVGLAISDPCNKVADPLSVLVRTKMNSELIATDFQSLISEYSLAGIVVGCPPSKTSAVQVKLFMDDLCKTGKLEGFEYTYWNEFNSSKIPELMLKPLKPHSVHAKTAIDKFAAIYILQGYLDYVNRKVKSSVLSKLRTEGPTL